MYRVVLTDSATGNEVAAARGGAGALLEYEDREAAAAAAKRYSEEGEVPVRLQAPAPQDPREVDAYLVANPERHVRRPSGTLDDGLEFETSAAQYGGLGEALLTSHVQDPPVLLAYARRTMAGGGVASDEDDSTGNASSGDERSDVESDEPAADSAADPATDPATDPAADPAVQLDADPEPVRYRSRETDETVSWLPDCAAVVTVDGAIERRLLCEVKTGDASTERDQRRVMQWAASDPEQDVLLVRLDVENLPDGYTARIQEIEPREPGREWISGEADRTLGEFG